MISYILQLLMFNIYQNCFPEFNWVKGVKNSILLKWIVPVYNFGETGMVQSSLNKHGSCFCSLPTFYIMTSHAASEGKEDELSVWNMDRNSTPWCQGAEMLHHSITSRIKPSVILSDTVPPPFLLPITHQYSLAALMSTDFEQGDVTV